jgi:hypothetical protein
LGNPLGVDDLLPLDARESMPDSEIARPARQENNDGEKDQHQFCGKFHDNSLLTSS